MDYAPLNLIGSTNSMKYQELTLNALEVLTSLGFDPLLCMLVTLMMPYLYTGLARCLVGLRISRGVRKLTRTS